MNQKMRAILAGAALQLAMAVPFLTYGANASAADVGVNIVEAITSASTKADHERIAAFYEQEAKALHEKVAQHEEMTKAYSSNWSGKAPGGISGLSMQAHCKNITTNYTAAMSENMELAKAHRAMAAEANK